MGAAGRTGVRPAARLLFLICIASFLLAAFLVAPVTPAVQASTQSELQQKLNETRRALEKAKEGQRQAQEVKAAAQEEITGLNARIAEIDAKLQSLAGKKNEAEAKLASLRDELNRVSGELEKKRTLLAKTEADLATQTAVLEQRAVDIYKAGRVGFIEVLFMTEQLSDLVNRLDLLASIVQHDSHVLTKIEELQAKVTREKNALEEERARVASLEKEQAGQTQALKDLVAEEQSTLAGLADAKAKKKAVVAQAEQEAAAWARQEEDLLAESASIQAELSKQAGGSSSASVSSVKGTGQLVWPVNGRLSSRFGMRMHPISKVWKMHNGIDVSASSGTNIVAADSGSVTYAGWRGGYGLCTIVSHGNGLATLYAHQSQILVSSGHAVQKGQVIGKVGSTGYSTGPHLHFEVRVNGAPVDPMRYL